MYIPLIVCIVGFMAWFIFTREETGHGVLGEAGKWSFILGLAFSLWFYGAKY